MSRRLRVLFAVPSLAGGGAEAVTYKALNERVNRLANALLDLGMKKGDRVGLLFHNSYGYLESYLALYKAGLVWVRLNARLTPKEHKAMLDDSEARALIHDEPFTKMVEGVTEGLEWVIQKGEGPGQNYDEMLSNGAGHDPSGDRLTKRKSIILDRSDPSMSHTVGSG